MSSSSKNTQQQTTLSGVVDTMAPRFAFRIGFFTGALVLSGILFVFLFVFFGLGGRQIASTGAGIADTSQTGGGGGVLPEPFPVLSGEELTLREDDHIRGDRNADILLIEYSDFECPFCQKFHPTAETLLEEGIDGKSVAWVYRHLPLDFHEDAFKAAEASECVADLAGEDAFWRFTDAYYEETETGGEGLPREEHWDRLAREAGVTDLSAFNTCIDTDRMADRVQADMDSAAALDITGTPGNAVVDQSSGVARLVSGAYPLEAFSEVAQLLEEDE